MTAQPPPQYQPPYQQQPPYQPQYQYAPPPTAAGPAPGVRWASSGSRLVAYFIDQFILGFVVFAIVMVAILAFGGSVNRDGTPGAATAVALLLIFAAAVVGILWRPWFWSHGGQTPGYKVLGMRVVRARDGGPVSFGTAFLRLLGYIVSGAVFYLGFIWIIFDGQHQGWHDKLAGTVVIQA